MDFLKDFRFTTRQTTTACKTIQLSRPGTSCPMNQSMGSRNQYIILVRAGPSQIPPREKLSLGDPLRRPNDARISRSSSTGSSTPFLGLVRRLRSLHESLRHSNLLGFRAPLRRPSWSRRAKQCPRLKNRFQVTPESFLGPGSAVSGHFPGEAKDPGGTSSKSKHC